jgi:type IV pilus biogenesis protein CpaD/CtpE
MRSVLLVAALLTLAGCAARGPRIVETGVVPRDACGQPVLTGLMSTCEDGAR